MGFINLAEKTVNAKLVYYGVGLGGKTTSLKVVHGLMCPRDEVKLVSINTEQDSTLLFDFLPIDLGQVEGFKIRVRGFTVPGQIQYVAMRKYVLSGADAVVLVVDSQRSKIEDNLQSIEDLKTNLVANGLDWQSIPLVIQYNKRDLPDVVPEDELDKHFLFREARCFQTIATEGKGVFETFMEAVSMMVEEKVGHYGLGKGSVTPKDVASEARQRLAGFLPGKEDAGARSGSAVEESGLVSLTVPHDVTVPIGAEEAAPSSKGRKQATARGAEGSRRKKKKKGKKAAGKRPSAPAKGKGPRRESAEGELSDADLSELFTDQDIAAELGEEATGLLGQAMSSNMELAGLYAELAEYKSLLEKKNRELVEVNQLISHDLGKPLTVFKTVMGLLLGDHLGDLGPKQRDAVQNALEATHYMEELIGDILEASRLDYDGFQFKFESIDMTLLIGSLIRRLRFHLEEQRVRVRVEPLPVIQGDQCALQKVFMNLIGNAASYRDLEKDISLITIAASQSGADWIFEVRDNGVGIPEDSHDRIFKKFCRGSNTGSISGTGLGLYIVREYARGHGGEVTVESKVGEGTTFFVRIPQEPTQALHSPVA